MKKTIVFITILLLVLFLAQTHGISLAGPIEDLKPGEWYEVPNSKIRSVLPNPIPPGGSGPESIIIAWNSGAYDTTRDRYIITGGGHNDYGGNELYAFSINTLTWSRVWGPSANIPATQGSCNETYSDGAPVSRHTYDGLEYLPNVDRFWVHGGSLYCAGGNASMATWEFNFNNSTWSRRANGYQVGELEEVSAYDSVTGHIFAAGPASSQRLSEYNPTANIWTTRGDSVNYGQTAEIDPVRRKFVSVGSGNAYIFDLNLSSPTRQPLNSTGDTTIVSARYPGLAYDPVSDRIIGWNGGASVYSLNLDTRVWTKINPSASNTVIPTNPPSQGNFNRWRYVPSKNVFIVVNSIDENVYIYKLSSGTGTPSSPDTQAPTAPTNLSATAISSSQVNLSWTASNDNVGVTGYRIYRGGSQIGTSATNSYSDTGLSPSTSYSYTVQAYDAAGNVSSQSFSASATTQASGGSTVTGLDFPGNGSGTVRFKFTNPHTNGLPIYGPGGNGVTYIWKAYPRQQSEYYTTFFWANDDGMGTKDSTFYWHNGDQDTYYGAHPYPPTANRNYHEWEIACRNGDFTNNSAVTYNRWHTQVFQAWRDANGYKVHIYYWDWPDQNKVIYYSTEAPNDPNYGETNPPYPALTWGDAPWQPGLEVYDGILRGIQIYNTNLSLLDIQSEIDSPLSTSAGASNIWYLNSNPTPTDISDKSGKGHNPSWVGSNRPTLYTEGAVSDTSIPTTPTNLSATAISSSQINLSWIASTDNVGVTGYRLERCQGTTCTNFSQIATPTGTSYNDTGLSASTAYSYRIRATDAVGNLSGYSSISNATTQAVSSPPSGQINITPGIFYALTGPSIGSGIDSASNKHTTWAHNPLDGRLYSIGGDFSSQYSYADSYEQEQYSLSLYERWTNQSNSNAGWRLEYPYCGPDGGVQPKSPDFIGWNWDSTRNVFWAYPGTFVIPVYASCSDRTASTSDDPKYKFRHIMSYNPAEPDLTKRWTDYDSNGGPSRGEPWMGFYDPVTDTITKFSGSSDETADIYNVQTKTWSSVGYGPNAVGGTVRLTAAVSPDFEQRVAYIIDGDAGRLMRWNMDSRTLSDLGTIPDGPTTGNNAYTVWDSINKVLILFHHITGKLYVYHPTTAIWETPPQSVSPLGLTPNVRHAMVFDPYQNVVALLGNTSGDNHIYLYRYANAPASLKGDVNKDSSVDILDVQALVNHILGIQDYGTNADVNGDGSVDVLDVQAIVNIILGV